MGRPSYVCTVCSEYFTRKYSANRHNHNLHNGAAEIVRLIDYLAGRSSGQYTANNPFWYKRNNPYHKIGSLTAADSVGNTFEPTHLRQQAPLGISQYPPSAMYRPLPIMDHQSYGTGLSQETKLKELKRLVYKYAQFHNNSPDAIVGYATYRSINGDDTLLDQKLAQLHLLDSLIFDNKIQYRSMNNVSGKAKDSTDYF
jgi:hypothetical protein